LLRFAVYAEKDLWSIEEKPEGISAMIANQNTRRT